MTSILRTQDTTLSKTNANSEFQMNSNNELNNCKSMHKAPSQSAGQQSQLKNPGHHTVSSRGKAPQKTKPAKTNNNTDNYNNSNNNSFSSLNSMDSSLLLSDEASTAENTTVDTTGGEDEVQPTRNDGNQQGVTINNKSRTSRRRKSLLAAAAAGLRRRPSLIQTNTWGKQQQQQQPQPTSPKRKNKEKLMLLQQNQAGEPQDSPHSTSGSSGVGDDSISVISVTSEALVKTTTTASKSISPRPGGLVRKASCTSLSSMGSSTQSLTSNSGEFYFQHSLVVDQMWQSIKSKIVDYEIKLGEQILLRMMELDPQARQDMDFQSVFLSSPSKESSTTATTTLTQFEVLAKVVVVVVDLMVSVYGPDLELYADDLDLFGKECKQKGIRIHLLAKAAPYAIQVLLSQEIRQQQAAATTTMSPQEQSHSPANTASTAFSSSSMSEGELDSWAMVLETVAFEMENSS